MRFRYLLDSSVERGNSRLQTYSSIHEAFSGKGVESVIVKVLDSILHSAACLSIHAKPKSLKPLFLFSVFLTSSA